MALQGLIVFVDDVVFQACFLNILNIGFVICCVELPEREHRAPQNANIKPRRPQNAKIESRRPQNAKTEPSQEPPERENRAQEAPERED